MGVVSREGGGGWLPTPLDFSTNSSRNSVSSLPESLLHVSRPFGGSLAVSRTCWMSLEQKLPELCCYSWSPTTPQLRNSTYHNNHRTETAKSGINWQLACHIYSGSIISVLDLQLVMKLGVEGGQKSARFMDSHSYFQLPRIWCNWLDFPDWHVALQVIF